MAGTTSILAEKLHEYPQQNVIDGASGGIASVLDSCLNKNGGVLPLLHRYAGRTFCTPGKRLRLMRSRTIPTTWVVRDSMNSGCAAPFRS